MDLKGELKQGALPSLFRNFATENFAGVLTVSSPVGEKLITLTENEVTIYSDELNESSRIGNILMAREKVSLENIELALRDQKKIEPHPLLGDMLVQRGLVTQQDCADARRFQIEEDIGDILSWKGARFHFAGRDSARVIRPEDFAPDQVHRLAIDPESFFKSVTKMSEDWETIGKRLPTQYLCFKVSPKAEEQKSKLSAHGQKILKLLAEGRTIEGVVKFACFSRIEVCVQVIELLEKGMILPTSGPDLRFQASEHRAQQRYHDALYIYRRILENPESEEEKRYLENLVAETSREILDQKISGGFGEEVVILSHREAKVRFQRAQKYRTIVAAIVLIGVLIGGIAVWVRRSQISSDEPQRYKQMLEDVEAAEKANDFNKAKVLLRRFYESMEDKESASGRSVSEQIMKLPGKIDAHIASQLPQLEVGVQSAAEEVRKALAGLQNLKDTFPGNKHMRKIDELIAQGDAKLKESNPPTVVQHNDPKELSRVQLQELFDEGFKKQGELKFAAAKRLFEDVARGAQPSDVLARQAEEALRVIQGVEARAKSDFDKYTAERNAKRGEAALAILSKMRQEYPDLEIIGTVVPKEQELLSRKKATEESWAKAKDEEKQGKIYQAITTLALLYETYPEWPAAEDARKKVAELQGKIEGVRQELDAALELVKAAKWSEARKIFEKLLQSNEQMLIDQKVEVPVFINSSPTGSDLRVNNESVGKTPQNVMIGVGKPFEIVVTRAGYKQERRAKTKIEPVDLQMNILLSLAPVVKDLKVPLPAPPASYQERPLLPVGPSLMLINPPGGDPLWTLPGLFNDRDHIPDGAVVEPGEGKNFWNCRVSPQQIFPDKFLLPIRNREVLEIDVTGGAPQKTYFLRAQPSEMVGRIYFEEKSRLAQKALVVAPFADGMLRVFRAETRPPGLHWSMPVDPETNSKEAPAAGPYAYKSNIYVLSMNGWLSALDIIDQKELWKQKFDVMSSRSTFSTVPNDYLAALVLRNGRVILFDLERQKPVWELPKRQAMQESVGALIDAAGVYVVTTNNDAGMLQYFDRKAELDGRPKELWSVALQGHVDIDMSMGKDGKLLYMVTHLNRVLAIETGAGRQRWEYKMDTDLGKPLWIRAIGEYVYVGTAAGKLLILKAD